MQDNKYQGQFIVFEGLDGSGQSTQAAKLVDFLNNRESKLQLGHGGAHLTKEPTTNLIGGLIRAQLTSEWKTKSECLQLLFAADRAHHLEKEIMPLLEKGVFVVSDRYFFSTIAYGMLEIQDWDWLRDINKPFLLPDISIFLKVSPKICVERIRESRFSVELFEKEEVLGKVWEGYERLAKEFKNVHIIDGERPIEEIFEEIRELICSKLIKC